MSVRLDFINIVAMVCFLFGLSLVVGIACGCSRPSPQFVQNVENAAAVAQYEAMLDDCRAQGKATNSFSVYKSCADAVDDHLCAQHRLRCPEDR